MECLFVLIISCCYVMSANLYNIFCFRRFLFSLASKSSKWMMLFIQFIWLSIKRRWFSCLQSTLSHEFNYEMSKKELECSHLGTILGTSVSSIHLENQNLRCQNWPEINNIIQSSLQFFDLAPLFPFIGKIFLNGFSYIVSYVLFHW